jgi:hypothetical protein
MIAHHVTLTSLGVEIGIVVALLVLFGTIAWRERRRRGRRSAATPVARMREDESTRER